MSLWELRGLMVLTAPGIWWSLSDSIKRWLLTSPKACFRSANVITEFVCFNWALFMICISVSTCSTQTGTFSQKCFWRFYSICSPFPANSYSLFWITDVNIFEVWPGVNFLVQKGYLLCNLTLLRQISNFLEKFFLSMVTKWLL